MVDSGFQPPLDRRVAPRCAWQSIRPPIARDQPSLEAHEEHRSLGPPESRTRYLRPTVGTVAPGSRLVVVIARLEKLREVVHGARIALVGGASPPLLGPVDVVPLVEQNP
jgi:hypothetical protein